MATATAQDLARLDAIPRLVALRNVQDDAERRILTNEVHAILLSTWKNHREWNGMARHLVQDVHSSFRRGFEQLVQRGASRREVNVKAFQQLDRNLHHHHSIEDHSWFPRLKHLHPESRAEVEILEKDHRKLIALEPQVVAGNYDALVEFHEHLMDHLNREEMLSVPWLLDGTGGL